MKPTELFSAAINEINNRLPFSAVSKFKKQTIDGQSGSVLLSHCLSRYNCRIIPIASVLMLVFAFITGILENALTVGEEGFFIGPAAEIAGEIILLVTAVFGIALGFYFSGKYPSYYPYVFWGMYLLSYFVKVSGCINGASGFAQTVVTIAVLSAVPIFGIPATLIFQLSVPIYYAVACGLNNVVTYYPFIAFCLCAVGILVSLTVYSLYCSRMINSRKIRESSRRIELNSKLDRQSGLYTREYGLDAAREMMKRGSTAIILVDIDDFSAYNKTVGPTTADRVLKEICNCIKIVAKPYTDIASRFEGDKIMLALPCEKDSEALLLCEEIRSSVKQMGIDFTKGKYLVVTATVAMERSGVNDDLDAVFEKAAFSLNAGKNAGGNCIAFKGKHFRAEEH